MKMRVNICSCLLVFVLGCNVTAALVTEVLEERTSVTLPCPWSVDSVVKWSREMKGHKVDILTIVADRDIKLIDDPFKRLSSHADKSLYIRGVIASDSGRYFCNNTAAAELTVIPSGTVKVNAPERTTVTLECPHEVGGSGAPSWSTDSNETSLQVPAVGNMLTITDVQPGHSGLYYCDGKAAVYLTVIPGNKAPPTTPTPPTVPEPPTTPTPPTVPEPPTTPTPPTVPEPPTTPTPPTVPEPPTTPTPPTVPEPPTTPTPPTVPEPPTTPTKKRRDRKKNRGKKTGPPATTTPTRPASTTTPFKPAANTVAGDQQPHPDLIFRTVVHLLFLLLLITTTIIITYFTRRRRRFKIQGGEETCHVYDEIQDRSVPRPSNDSSQVTSV